MNKPIAYVVILPAYNDTEISRIPCVVDLENTGYTWAIAKMYEPEEHKIIHKCKKGWVYWQAIVNCPICDKRPPDNVAATFKLLV